ncbi:MULTISPECIES: hypothetical protein [unclassified Aeromonas]|uniref:hypothetical protein n=1 Tax=unclassified Aeromonas TaxID=257493 RepID=UPI00084A848E|nr:MULTISPECIES: hypothetical protein [unclassified Aeromonas]OEC41385.1 hypothetical protein A9G06_13805 [Aeromonas sp. DNP9]OEC48739.1 hypothetical protein A9G04_20880 [Aeromonas sp. ANNP30]OEC60780.1 hypothetical protein A9G49_20945 [Aeromonas sp. ANP5]
MTETVYINDKEHILRRLAEFVRDRNVFYLARKGKCSGSRQEPRHFVLFDVNGDSAEWYSYSYKTLNAVFKAWCIDNHNERFLMSFGELGFKSMENFAEYFGIKKEGIYRGGNKNQLKNWLDQDEIEERYGFKARIYDVTLRNNRLLFHAPRVSAFCESN